MIQDRNTVHCISNTFWSTSCCSVVHFPESAFIYHDISLRYSLHDLWNISRPIQNLQSRQRHIRPMYARTEDNLAVAEQESRCESMIRIEFYNGIVRFLCHNTDDWFSRQWRKNHGDGQKSRHTMKITVKVTVIVNKWLPYSVNKCYNKCSCLSPLLLFHTTRKLATSWQLPRAYSHKNGV